MDCRVIQDGTPEMVARIPTCLSQRFGILSVRIITGINGFAVLYYHADSAVRTDVGKRVTVDEQKIRQLRMPEQGTRIEYRAGSRPDDSGPAGFILHSGRLTLRVAILLQENRNSPSL